MSGRDPIYRNDSVGHQESAEDFTNNSGIGPPGYNDHKDHKDSRTQNPVDIRKMRDKYTVNNMKNFQLPNNTFQKLFSPTGREQANQ